MVNGVVVEIGDNECSDSFDGVKRAVVAEIVKALVLMLCEIFLSCFASITIASQQS